MRVLHVIYRYPPAIGGGETWCAGLAAWQAASGHAVRVLTLRAVSDDELWGPHRWGDDLAHVLPRAPGSLALGTADRLDGVDVRRCRVSEPVYALSRALVRIGLPGLAWGHSPEFLGRLVGEARWADVVHVYGLGGAQPLAAWLATRLPRRPLVLTPFLHEGFAEHESWLAASMLRRADRVIVLTEFEAAAVQARGVPAARITRAANAVRTPAVAPGAPARVRGALGVPADAPLLCYVGRKAFDKGLDLLLEAMRTVRHRPAPWLALAGPTTDWYRELRRSGPAGRVVDLPVLSVAAKAELLAAADLLVLPSSRESFGTVFLEAWSVGTPVLGADVRAVREVLGAAGRTFRAGDAADLAASIDALLGAPEAQSALAARGRAVAAWHTWDRLGRIVVSAYAAAATGGGASTPAGVPEGAACP